ncbi:MAG: hypothetical protein EOO38_06740 [Cytophagaceae bacterium]|nr:MAG: hypothetical protein EOO38_06740 [Cytophagaceae bacterium]
MTHEVLTLTSLHDNPENPRRITSQRLEMLKRSLVEFGDLSPICFNIRTGQLLGGHQRKKALLDRFGDAAITITNTYEPPTAVGTVREGYLFIEGERFAYREVDFDETREKLANLAANRGAGDFDEDALKVWLAKLSLEDANLDLTMFDADERALLLDESAPSFDDDSSTEEATEVDPASVATRVQMGQVWQLGKHRLMCGDSSDVACLDVLMDGKTADMVYTDPPYGMKLKTDYDAGRNSIDNNRYSKHQSTAGVKRNKWRPVHGDDVDFDPSILFGYFQDVSEMFLWGADYYCQALPAGGSWVVWDKRSKQDGTVIEQFKASHFELCWSKKRHLREIARILWSGIMKAEHDGARVHPTQKPVMLAEWFFERWGKTDDVVADIYGGSGSTLLACEKASLPE